MGDERLERLEAEMARLRAEQAGMSQILDALSSTMGKRLEKETILQRSVGARLTRLEATSTDTAKLLKAMVNSRIWKILQAVGGLLLIPIGWFSRKAPARVFNKFSATERKEHIQMRCDLISERTIDPVAGKIEITGWAVAPEGIENVAVQVGDSLALRVRFGISRADIEGLFPGMKGALRSGFAAGLDTRELQDGVYRLKITAKTRKGVARELLLPFVVNQEIGVIGEYGRWLETFETREDDMIRVLMAGWKYCPLVSVVVPVFRTNLEILRETIDSVKRQSYKNWELCIADDASEMPELTSMLLEAASQDSRIKVVTRAERGGISAASNSALALGAGEYVALLDHDDLFAQDALFHIVDELQVTPRPDLLYSDEDHIDESGRRFSPFFKPDWSPDLILSENYVTHLMVFRRDLLLEVGGFRTEFDLSQDHDILLRMSEKARRIVHVPKVLYHWRTSLQSMSRASLSEEKALASSRSVVEDFVRGRATVEPGLYPGRWRVRYPVPEGSRVSILIPTAGKTEVLERNLKALWNTAGYDAFEVVLIDNSRGETIVTLAADLQKSGRPVRRFDQRGQPFNYSRINNLAAAECGSELLLFLNDDTEGISPGWLLAMVELAMRPEVGAVGAKLLYPDGLIQHGGVTMGLAEICGHSFKGLTGDTRHYYDFPDLIRNVSAVTAACVMIRTDVFREVGGFDEVIFPIAYNDIDLTLKIGAAGYRVLYTPHALLYHYEAFSKSREDLHPHPTETLALKSKWKEVIRRDPFYNPNLTRHIENWSLRWD